MSVSSGQKAKLVNVLDSHMADDLQPLYSIEIVVSKSPKQGVKCGAICVFKLNTVDLDFESKLNPRVFNPKMLQRAQEIQDQVNKQTDRMHQDPIYFKETEGRWLPWAMDKALAIYDRVGGNAKISLKCPPLQVTVTRSSKEVAKYRSNPRQLFPILRDIDILLDRGFQYDPWNGVLRRGRVDAETSKR